MHRIFDRAHRVVASNKFFVFIIALLVFQATWIVLSFRYPMMWDEYYHFGLIQYYGHHLNPIISHQPTSLDLYGNVERSPKYLYHWLMSFPYRLVALWIHNTSAQIIILRFINVAMFAGGLVAFRSAMLRLIKSRVLIHFVLLVLVLLPLSPMLAAHINYDNFEFLLTGLVLLWTLQFLQHTKFDMRLFLLVLGGSLAASLAKYTFLPVFLAILIMIVWRIWQRDGRKVWSSAHKSYLQLDRVSMVGLTLLVVVGGLLMIERFGINMVKYHNINPDCAVVLSTERCMSFSPYKFNYNAAKVWNIPAQTHFENPISYTVHDWFPQLYGQYFSTGTQLGPDTFAGGRPVSLPYKTLLVGVAIGIICFFIKIRSQVRRQEVWLVALTIGGLAAALWLEDFAQYKYTGWPVAIQGRYLLPVLPLGMLLLVMSVQKVIKWQKVQIGLATLLVLGLLWGGGVITHIVGSQSNWWWQNSLVQRINTDAKNVLSPITF